MADLLYADAVQQLEVALLGSPVVDVLAEGLTQAQASTSLVPVQSHPKFSTTTPPTPLTSSALVLGISTSSTTPEVVHTFSSDIAESAVPESKEMKVSDIFPFWHITSIQVESSLSTSTTSLLTPTSVTTLPVVVVSEVAIAAEAYPEWINRPDGGKDYLCCLCLFRHLNLDCILTHVRKHLEIIISCPICCKGYWNAMFLCKHGRNVHKIPNSCCSPLRYHPWGTLMML